MAGALAGKIALVTGGASGIGKAAALALAGAGASVVVSDLACEAGRGTAQEIHTAGGKATFVETDVTNAAQVEALIERVVDEHGRLDCAFNNAGIEGAVASLTELAEEQWDDVLNVNLKGVWLCMKYELRQMIAQESGSIVNTSSIMGQVACRDASAYIAAKHGVVGLTRAAAVENAALGIRVNALCPGYIRTPMVERLFAAHPEIEKSAEARHPVGRLGLPEEVAAAVVWLCSDAASFVTGQALPVDGGYLAQ